MPRKHSKTANEVDEPISTKSSGNVFADLELPNPELLLAKADLVVAIIRTIRERELTQKQAAELMGIDQPKISALLRGQTRGYTLDRLFKLLVRLGCHIDLQVSEIAIEPRSPSIG